MMNHNKYIRQYFMPPVRSMKWAEKEYVDHAPVWCSVDLTGWQSGTCRSDVSGAKSTVFPAPRKDRISRRSRSASRQLPIPSTSFSAL